MVTLNIMRWGDRGAAKTMVALHGITANAGAMTEPARVLAERGWQVIAPDMRGHGESARGNGDFSFDSLLSDFAENLPAGPDVLLGHSFGGTLAQLGVLRGLFRPKALLLEDPVSHFADKATPKGMLDWDEANMPHDIEGLLKLNPGWSRRDAAWKVVSLEQISFDDARSAFAGNAPWDLRDEAARLARMLPTVWVLPEDSRFVPPGDTARLRAEAGERSVVVMPNVGHSIHRDATQAFVDIVEKLGAGTWFDR
ncbi:MAG: alpha/beta fold hydrolase [Hyphomicrobiales bacterium]|nr:MAG: alpha/beta fold hydrolase [Hyphomicrobiales bacterium]